MRMTILFLAVAGLWAQTSSGPAWKEFSIGPMVKPGGRYGNDGIRGDGVPLKKVIAKAYGLPEHRIVGPDWVNVQRYQWTAVVADPVNFQPFMQQELASRLCGDQGIPPKLEGKLNGFQKISNLVCLELVSRRII